MVLPGHPITVTLAICLILQVNGSILPASIREGLITRNPQSSKEVLLNKDVLNQLLQNIFPSASKINLDIEEEAIQVVNDEVDDLATTQEEPKQITVGNLEVDLSQLRKLPPQEPRRESYDTREANEPPQDLYYQPTQQTPNPMFYQPPDQSFKHTYETQQQVNQYNLQQEENTPDYLNQKLQRTEDSRGQSSLSLAQPSQEIHRRRFGNEHQHRTRTSAAKNPSTYQEESAQQRYQQQFAQQHQQQTEQQAAQNPSSYQKESVQQRYQQPFAQQYKYQHPRQTAQQAAQNPPSYQEPTHEVQQRCQQPIAQQYQNLRQTAQEAEVAQFAPQQQQTYVQQQTFSGRRTALSDKGDSNGAERYSYQQQEQGAATLPRGETLQVGGISFRPVP